MKVLQNFINNKVKLKYADKTKELAAVPNLKILPILDYVDKLIEFAPKVNMSISLPPLTVVKNTIDGNERTQKEVADALGISQSYISRLEKRIMVKLKDDIERKITLEAK